MPGLDVQANFDKTFKQLDRLIDALNRVEVRLEGAGKAVNTLDRLFGGARNFQSFITQVNRLSEVSSKNFGLVAAGLDQIATATERLRKVKDPSASLTTIINLVKQYNSLRAPKATTLQPLIEIAQQSVEVGRILKEAVKNLSPTKTYDPAATVRAIGQIVTAYNSLPEVVPKNLQAVVDGLRMLTQIGQVVREMMGIASRTELEQATATVYFFDSLFTAMQKVGQSGLPQRTDFTAYISAVRSFLDQAKTLPPLPTSVLRTINAVASLIRALHKASADIADADILLINLETFFSGFRHILLLMSQPMPGGGQSQLSRPQIQTINALSDIIRAFDKLSQTEIPVAATQRIENFLRTLRDVLNEIRALPPLDTDQNRSLNAISSTITAVIRTLSTSVDVGQIDVLAKRFAAFVGTIAHAFQSAAVDPKQISSLAALLRIMLRLMQEVTQAKAIAPSGFDPLIQFALNIGKVLVAIRAATNVGAADMAVVQRSTDFIRALVLAFTKGLDTVNPDQVRKLGDIFRAIVEVLTLVSTSSARTFDLSALDTIAGAIKRLMSGLRSLTELDMGGIQGRFFGRFGALFRLVGGGNAQTNQLLQFFDFFNIISRTLSKAASGLARAENLSALDTLIGSISKISNALPRILKAAQSLPQGATRLFRLPLMGAIGGRGRFDQLRQFFDFVRFISRQLASATRGFLGRPLEFGDVSKIVDTVNAISRAIPAILQASKTLPRGTGQLLRLPGLGAIGGKGRFNQLREFFDFVRFIARELRRLPKNIPNVAAIFNDLVTFSKNIKGVTFDLKDLRATGFKAYVRELALGLAELNKIQVDPRRLEAASKAMQAAAGISRHVSQLRTTQSRQPVTQQTAIVGGLSAADIIANEFIRRATEGAIQALGKFITTLRTVHTQLLTTLRDMGQSMVNFGRQIGQAGHNLLRNFGLDKLLRSGGLGIATEFEEIGSQLRAVLPDEQQLTQAQELADIIGIKYPLSANQALSAILQLSKAGQSLGDIRNILPSASNLAAVIDSKDLNLATRALIASVTAFGRFTDEIPAGYENINTAADILVGAADASTASVESLTEALADVGPAARNTNQTFEEINAALALFEDGNLRGSKAGRAMRSILGQLIRPQTVQEFQRLDIALTNADGTFRSINDIFKDLSARYQQLGLNQAQVAMSLRTMFDEFARQGASLLVANRGIDDYLQRIREADTAQEKFAISIDNLRGDAEQLRGSFETLLKNAFMPLIRRVFRPVTQGLLAITNAILTLPQSALDTVTTMLALAAAAATLAGAGLILTGVFVQVAGALTSLLGGLGLLLINGPKLLLMFGSLSATLLMLLPVLLAVGGGLVVVAGNINAIFRVIEEDIRGAAGALNTTIDLLKQGFAELQRIVSVFGGVLRAVFGDVLGEDLENRSLRLQFFLNRLNAQLRKVVDTLRSFDQRQIIKFFVSFEQEIRGFIIGIRQFSSGVFEILLGNLDEGLNRARLGISTFLSSIARLTQRASGIDLSTAVLAFDQNNLRLGIESFIHTLALRLRESIISNQDSLRELGLMIVRFLNPFSRIEAITRLLGLDAIANLFGGVADTIEASFRNIFNIVISLVEGKDLGTILAERFGRIGTAVAGLIHELNRAGAALGRIFDTIGGLVLSFINLFTGGSFEAAAGTAENVISRLIDAFSSVVNFLTVNILEPLADNLPGIISRVQTFIGQLLRDLQPMVSFFQTVGREIGGFYDTLVAFFAGDVDLGTLIAEFGRRIVATLARLPQALGETLINLGDTLGSDFVTGLGESLVKGDVVEFLMRSAEGLIRALFDFLGQLLRSIPDQLIGLGESLDNPLLVALGLDLKAGDIARATVRLGAALFEIIRGAAENAFRLAVSAIDDFLDLFENRVVGGIVLALGTAFVAGLPTILPLIRGGLVSLFTGAINGILGLIQSLAAKIGLTFAASLSLPGAAIVAAAVGYFALIAHTIANDPDAQAAGEQAAMNVAEGFIAAQSDVRRLIDFSLSKLSIGQIFAQNLNNAFAIDRGRIEAGIRVFDVLMGRALQAALDVGRFGNLFNNLLSRLAEGIRQTLSGALSVIPEFFANLADQAEDEFTRGLLITLMNALKIIRNIISELAALPVQMVASGFEAAGVVIRTVVQIALQLYGVIRSIVIFILDTFGYVINLIGQVLGAFIDLKAILDGIGDAVASLGLGNAIQQFAQIVTILAGIALVITGVVVGYKKFGGAARTAAADTSVLNTELQETNLLMLDAAAASQTAATKLGVLGRIRQGFGRVGGFLKNALQVGATMLVIQGAFEAITNLLSGGNLLSALLTFIKEVGGTVLRALGLDDVVDQAEIAIEQLEFLLNLFFTNIGRGLHNVFASIAGAFNDLRARLEQASADLGLSEASQWAQDWFRLGDAIRDAANITGEDFFGRIQQSVLDGADPQAISQQLQLNADLVFKKYVEFVNDLDGNIAAGGEAMRAAIDALVRTDQIERAFKLAEGNLSDLRDLFSNISGVENQGKNFAAFFQSAVNSGLEQAGPGVKDAFRSQVQRFFDLGFISPEQAADFFETLGFHSEALSASAGGAAERFALLNQSLRELFDTIRQENIGDLERALRAGEISAAEFMQRMTEFAREIPTTIENLRQQQISLLSAQLQEGLIDRKEFDQKFADINAQAVALTAQAVEEEILRIQKLRDEGKLTITQAAEGIVAIQDAFDSLRLPPALQQQWDDYIEAVATGSLTAAEQLERFREIQAAMTAWQSQQAAGEAPAVPEVDTSAATAIGEEFGEDFAEGFENEAQNIQDKIDDFATDEQRRQRDERESEQEHWDKIQDIRDTAQAEVEEKEQQELIDRQRRLQDFQNSLLKINTDAAKSLEEAVAGRDASAARRALESRDEQLAAETAKFNLDEQRRAADLEREIKAVQNKAAVDAEAALAEYNALVAKNKRLQDERQFDHDKEIGRMRRNNADKATLENQAAANSLNAAATTAVAYNTAAQVVVNSSKGMLDTLAAITKTAADTIGTMGGGSKQAATTPSNNSIGNLAAAIIGNIYGGSKGGGGGRIIPTRRFGGEVLPGRLYEVAEPNVGVELMRLNSRTFLLSSRRAEIIPPGAVGRPAAAAAGGGGGFNLTVDLSGMVIQGGPSASPADIAAQVEQRVLPKITQTIRDVAKIIQE